MSAGRVTCLAAARRHQARRPPLAKIRPGLGQRVYGCLKQKRADRGRAARF
jgi:hypothetical protein